MSKLADIAEFLLHRVKQESLLFVEKVIRFRDSEFRDLGIEEFVN